MRSATIRRFIRGSGISLPEGDIPSDVPSLNRGAGHRSTDVIVHTPRRNPRARGRPSRRGQSENGHHEPGQSDESTDHTRKPISLVQPNGHEDNGQSHRCCHRHAEPAPSENAPRHGVIVISVIGGHKIPSFRESTYAGGTNWLTGGNHAGKAK